MQPSSCLNKPQQSSTLKDDSSTPHFGLAVSYASPSETNSQIGVSGSHLRPVVQPPLVKQFHGNLPNGADSLGETQVRNGRPRVDARGRSQLLPRYWPRFTDQDLQQISGEYPLILEVLLLSLKNV